MTGTSVNPALRAVYLAKDGHRVTLVVPWLPTVPEQRRVFAKGCPTFERREDHAAYIERWVREQVPTAVVRVLFYEGAYAHDFGSILPVGAITDIFAPMNVVKDVCILEEPEHLTWHHSGTVWTELFNIVVGIIHTNYVEYANGYGFFGPQRAMALLFLNVWVCRGYCHRVIKLSDAVQQFPNSVTCNVHGVRDKFIHAGRHRKGGFGKGAYFMGKVLWAKGYRDLVDNMLYHYREKGYALRIHFYGSGPDAASVQAEIDAEPALAAVAFDPCVADPLGANLRQYKVFVNASRSDVVCTATAEALAMGKLVVCLKHPSNEFFSTFPNCITYRTPAEFSDVVEDALRREPAPLSELDAYRLTWEAATERLYDAVRLPLSKSKPSKVGIALANVHASLSKIYPQPGKGIRIANSACLPADAR
ncbi:Digalactosyldiacylglycerol synthase, family GT4 [Chondrus crispus]|uniref:Digalactosyldiacylglycerol synthase, family GT4 n=1 Tax=Chondrus crispus TaxID=2769 RepID=R7QPK6_CHOCR|nr:Digalactosyldiacylglycerol synthase, family GT4 [Chondrus crispus]CDF39416.1 Digalactosyldiacylglycerol synthase, family GT4 [Chondrus crispus]|eukprot:XP_005719327.1 Digalactosyldiacylglycerol synthase, family GT4 [Chondrus crispus]